MKKKIFLFFLAAVLSIAATACGEADKPQSETTPKTSVTTSQTTKTESTSETIEYNGTFNEEVFNQICQNIKIGNTVISIPCTFEKMGEGFEMGEDPLLDKENGILSSELLYEDNIVGYISLRYTEDDKEWDDNEILGYSFSYYDIKNYMIVIIFL